MRNKPSKRRSPKSQKSGSRWTNYLVIGAVGLSLIVLAYLLYLNLQDPETLSGIQRFVGLSRSHDESVSYADLELPPVGGVHSGIWQNCGVYDEPVVSKNAVHAMEHGAVWIAHSAELKEGDVAKLHQQVWDEPYVLLSPYPNLRSPIVLSAWGVQLEIESADDDRIAGFIDQYQLGPQTPELGATCSSGLGTPLNHSS